MTTVCLPSSATSPAKAVVAGWGQSSRKKGGVAERKLQFAYLDTYSVEECQAKYDKLLAGRAKVGINRSMLCAGNEKADSCAGKIVSRWHVLPAYDCEQLECLSCARL